MPESHIGTWVPDPAGENEMIRVLGEIGFPIVDVSTLMENEPASWWATFFHGRAREGEGTEARLNIGSRSVDDLMHDKWVTRIKEKADISIVGEAFSENAGENLGFRSCKARVEVKAIDTKKESVAADPADEIAALVEGHLDLLGGNTVAVFPFPYVDGIASVEGALIAERALARLSEGGAVRVVERALLDKIMAEQKLSASGLVDPAAVEVGKLLGARGILLPVKPFANLTGGPLGVGGTIW